METERPVCPGMSLADIQAKNLIVHIWPTYDADRAITQSDIDSAARGLAMAGKSISELDDLIRQHTGKGMFASKVIVAAATQMKAAKQRMGARDEAEGDGGWRIEWVENGTTEKGKDFGTNRSKAEAFGNALKVNPRYSDIVLIDTRGREVKAFDSVAKSIVYGGDAKDADKVSKQEVEYSRGKGDSKCGNCVFFQAPNGCSRVEGNIDPNGWCRLFERGEARDDY